MQGKCTEPGKRFKENKKEEEACERIESFKFTYTTSRPCLY